MNSIDNKKDSAPFMTAGCEEKRIKISNRLSQTSLSKASVVLLNAKVEQSGSKPYGLSARYLGRTKYEKTRQAWVTLATVLFRVAHSSSK